MPNWPASTRSWTFSTVHHSRSATWGELSGGQRQLVLLAQVLVRQPDVLLINEPTSALDLHRQVEVLELVRDLAAQTGMVAIIALHELNQALRYAAQTLVLADGRLQAAGPTAEVVTETMLACTYAIRARIEPCRGAVRC